MMNAPLVSVIMTCHNMALHVEKAIYSILLQINTDIELIIIDDCSSDNSLEIIKNINDKRIKTYKTPEHKGTYYCKNFGIFKSTADYIAFQDADDISDLYRLIKSIDYLNLHPETMLVRSLYLRFYLKDNSLIFRSHLMSPISSVIRRDVINELGYFDLVKVGADSEYDERITKVYGKASVHVIEEVLYFALQNDKGLTSKIPLDSDLRRMYREDTRFWHHSGQKLNFNFPYNDIRPFEIRSKSFITPYTGIEMFKSVYSSDDTITKTNYHCWKNDLQTQITNFRKQIIDHYVSSLNEQSEKKSAIKLIKRWFHALRYLTSVLLIKIKSKI